jgi:hypothetical protein
LGEILLSFISRSLFFMAASFDAVSSASKPKEKPWIRAALEATRQAVWCLMIHNPTSGENFECERAERGVEPQVEPESDRAGEETNRQVP